MIFHFSAMKVALGSLNISLRNPRNPCFKACGKNLCIRFGGSDYIFVAMGVNRNVGYFGFDPC